MINNSSACHLGVQSCDSAPVQAFRALRGCESRLRDLQDQHPARDGRSRRDGPVREQARLALQQARTCEAAGGFEQAASADLAGVVNSFSKLRRFPVTREVDAILALVTREIGARCAAGSLSRWKPMHLALATNGLSKGSDACVKEAMGYLGQALAGAGPLTLEQGWKRPVSGDDGQWAGQKPGSCCP